MWHLIQLSRSRNIFFQHVKPTLSATFKSLSWFKVKLLLSCCRKNCMQHTFVFFFLHFFQYWLNGMIRLWICRKHVFSLYIYCFFGRLNSTLPRAGWHVLSNLPSSFYQLFSIHFLFMKNFVISDIFLNSFFPFHQSLAMAKKPSELLINLMRRTELMDFKQHVST